MNKTSLEIDDGFIPILEEANDIEVEDGSHGSIESSILKMIPKFFKAIVTLIICGLLLGVTFLLITLWKRGCRTHSKLKEDVKTKNGNAGGGSPLHSVIVTPPTDDNADESSRPDAIPSSSSLQPVRAKYIKVPMPKQALLRRASGPFGSEALSFVGEQYTMKTMETEGHHYFHHQHHHHGQPHGQSHGQRHSPTSRQPQYHSGASSAGGGSAQLEMEEDAYNETRTKWNCFKGNKE